MARRSPALLSNVVEIDRQAKRIGRQQKRLEKDLRLSPVDVIATPRNTALRLKHFEPITDNQARFWEAYDDAGAFVLYGSAGTGKSFLALYKAIQEVLDPSSDFSKIVIVRSTVQSRDMGFLPGDSTDKCAPFEEPYVQIFSEFFGKKDAYEKLKDMGKIEFCSTSLLRGVTFHDSIVVFDEFQSSNWHECKTILTRLGGKSKIIICGDFGQNDLIKNKNDVSGFDNLMQVTDHMPEFVRIKFYPEDIVRGPFVKAFLLACEKLGI